MCDQMLLSFSCGTCEPKCVCIVHLPVHPSPLLSLLPPGGGGQQGFEHPMSSRAPSSSPLSARQLGAVCAGPAYAGGWPLPLTSWPHPSSLCSPSDSYASDPSLAYSSLSSVYAWPGCCVTSQVQVLGQPRPSRARQGHSRLDQEGSRDQGREKGREGNQCLVAHFLSEMVSQCLGMGWGHTLGS